MTTPRLSILIVTYNSRGEIAGCVQSLIDARVTLAIEVMQVIPASDIAFVVSAWSVAARDSEHGSADVVRGEGTDVMRRQPDGSWRFVVDNPYGAAVMGKMGGPSTSGAIG